jgi:hypothetical protein
MSALRLSVLLASSSRLIQLSLDRTSMPLSLLSTVGLTAGTGVGQSKRLAAKGHGVKPIGR